VHTAMTMLMNEGISVVQILCLCVYVPKYDA